MRGIEGESYDKLGIPIDVDAHGNVYVLKNPSIITCRATCITKKSLLEKLRKESQEHVTSLKDAQISRIAQGERLLEDNKKCERLILEFEKRRLNLPC